MNHDLHWRPTSQEINKLPRKVYAGPIHLIRSLRQWLAALPDIASESVLGFDTETKPSFSKGKPNLPSLLQLATAGAVYVVQLTWFPFDEHCVKILANAEIIKAGVAIHEDMASLAKIYSFTPRRMIDLGEMARRGNLPNHGLRTLAASLFGWRIAKGAKCSNWSSRELSESQIVYAATDAWIGRMIYLRLKKLGLADAEISP